MSEQLDFSSDYLYIESKTKVNGECSCTNNKSICGVCFWKGITIPPNEAINKKCSRCLRDSKLVKSKILENPDTKTIEFIPECFSSCIWWEWFDFQRKSMASSKNIKIVYLSKS